MSIKISDIPKKSKAQPKSENPLLAMLNKDISFGGGQWSDNKKERFYSELSILFSAGVDIRTALEIVGSEFSNSSDKEFLKTIVDTVIHGGNLSEAIEKSGKFSPYEYHSLKIGEETGHLPEVLNDLSRYFARKISQRRMLVSALSYPVIVFVTAIGSVFFMLRFIVPMFEDVFKRFGGELPAITRMILSLSQLLSGLGYYVLAIVSLAFIIHLTQKKMPWYRHFFSSLALRVPVLRDILGKMFLARFCHSMHLLMSSNTPLVVSLELLEKMVSFYPIETSLKAIREEVFKGASLHRAMEKHSIYPGRMIALIKVAEEVNKLDFIFEKLAKQYNDDVEHQSSLISSILEPILIIFIGVFVAVILVAMYLPLFNLSTSIG